jgi:glycosyltransferase involved in cell wall biosynthesis
VEDHVNGLLCKLKDADDLAAKMRDMANYDNETLKAMGTNGRRKMEAEYDESIVIDKYLHTLTALKSL